MISVFGPFILAAALLTITPGLDTAIVLRFSLNRGRGAAFAAAAGVLLGVLAWGALAGAGIAALLIASPVAFITLELVGATYLVWIGVGLLRSSRRMFEYEEVAGQARPDRAANPFQVGLLTNLLNPKVGVFYLAFLPQFIPEGDRSALLPFAFSVVHALLGLIWFSVIILATVRLANVLRAESFVVAVDRLLGALFIFFAIRIVWETIL